MTKKLLTVVVVIESGVAAALGAGWIADAGGAGPTLVVSGSAGAFAATVTLGLGFWAALSSAGSDHRETRQRVR